METPLNPDLVEKLKRFAAERMGNNDEWFLREVHNGLEAADRGELVEHGEVRKIIDHRYPD